MMKQPQEEQTVWFVSNGSVHKGKYTGVKIDSFFLVRTAGQTHPWFLTEEELYEKEQEAEDALREVKPPNGDRNTSDNQLPKKKRRRLRHSP